MGADIHGWVEIRPRNYRWDAAIIIDEIVYRQYGMFASLFGVRNGGGNDQVVAVGHFRAIAPGRGEPPEASYFYREERGNYGGAVGETWVLWSELAAIDWDEEGQLYVNDGPSSEVYSAPGPDRRHDRRGDYLNGGWATLFKLMAVLAEQFGADNVRLSVWFDQW